MEKNIKEKKTRTFDCPICYHKINFNLLDIKIHLKHRCLEMYQGKDIDLMTIYLVGSIKLSELEERMERLEDIITEKFSKL